MIGLLFGIMICYLEIVVFCKCNCKYKKISYKYFFILFNLNRIKKVDSLIYKVIIIRVFLLYIIRVYEGWVIMVIFRLYLYFLKKEFCILRYRKILKF